MLRVNKYSEREFSVPSALSAAVPFVCQFNSVQYY